jgi:hypothetical protein
VAVATPAELIPREQVLQRTVANLSVVSNSVNVFMREEGGHVNSGFMLIVAC